MSEAMTPETQARELLERYGGIAYLTVNNGLVYAEANVLQCIQAALSSAQAEREAVVRFMQIEAAMARHAQAAAAVDHPDKLYRMGQKDGLLLAADAIERGEHAPPPTEAGEG